MTRACRGDLAPAMVGKQIDVSHPAVEDWLVARGLDVDIFDDVRAPAELNKVLGDSAREPLDPLLSMSLQELTDRHGSDERFYGWARARKELAMAQRAEAQLARLQGRLIARTTIDAALACMDGLHVRFLRDVARNLGSRLCKGTRTPEETEAIIRDQISAQLRAATQQIARAIAADDIDAPLRDPAQRKERK